MELFVLPADSRLAVAAGDPLSRPRASTLALCRLSPRPNQTRLMPQALRAFVPWAFLMVCLFAAGIWIVFQPMQMRGSL